MSVFQLGVSSLAVAATYGQYLRWGSALPLQRQHLCILWGAAPAITAAVLTLGMHMKPVEKYGALLCCILHSLDMSRALGACTWQGQAQHRAREYEHTFVWFYMKDGDEWERLTFIDISVRL